MNEININDEIENALVRFGKTLAKAVELYKPTDTEPQPCEECKFQGDTSFCDVCCHNYMSMFADKMQEVNADDNT